MFSKKSAFIFLGVFFLYALALPSLAEGTTTASTTASTTATTSVSTSTPAVAPPVVATTTALAAATTTVAVSTSTPVVASTTASITATTTSPTSAYTSTVASTTTATTTTSTSTSAVATTTTAVSTSTPAVASSTATTTNPSIIHTPTSAPVVPKAPTHIPTHVRAPIHRQFVRPVSTRPAFDPATSPSQVTIRVIMPNGAPPPFPVFLTFVGVGNENFGGKLNANGVLQVAMPSGRYYTDVMVVSTNYTQGSDGPSFFLAPNTKRDFGAIKLIQKSQQTNQTVANKTLQQDLTTKAESPTGMGSIFYLIIKLLMKILEEVTKISAQLASH